MWASEKKPDNLWPAAAAAATKVKKSIESGEKKRDTVKARPVTNSTTGRLRFEEQQQGYILLW